MSETFENGPEWFPMVQNMGLESKIKTLEGSEQKLPLSNESKETRHDADADALARGLARPMPMPSPS